MKIIIAGSRKGFDYAYVAQQLNAFHAITPIAEVVCGAAGGVDTFGREWAHKNKIKCTEFPALWNTHGRGAGFKRNEQMALYADLLIAFWDNKSEGTASMILQMNAWNKPVLIISPA